jgi:hypothetical protein
MKHYFKADDFVSIKFHILSPDFKEEVLRLFPLGVGKVEYVSYPYLGETYLVTSSSCPDGINFTGDELEDISSCKSRRKIVTLKGVE